MIDKIFKQLWSQRRSNAWLFAELVVISVFLWQAIDPLYTYTAIRQFPVGCDYDNVYICKALVDVPKRIELYASKDNPNILELGAYERMDNDILQVFKGVSEIPEIESTAYASLSPLSSMSQEAYTADSASTLGGEAKETRVWSYEGGGDLTGVFRIRDYFTGDIMEPLDNVYDIYISYSAAMEMFGTTDCIGKEIFDFDWVTKKVNVRYTVKGIYKDIKENLYSLPIATFIHYLSELNMPSRFLLRLKDGVDKERFVKEFNENIAGKLQAGAYSCSELKPYGEEVDVMVEGERNGQYFQLFLSFFAVFCAFLGIVSTFWIRTSARSGEIGIMRSMGASRHRIIVQFVTEALLLVTMAFAVALPLIAYMVIANDFAQPIIYVTNVQLAEYCKAFATAPRFAVITVITYLIIAATAAAAAIIPAARACKTGIADALHEE